MSALVDISTEMWEFFWGRRGESVCSRCCVGWRILWGLEIEKNMDDSGVSKSNPLNRVNDIIVINIVKGFYL